MTAHFDNHIVKVVRSLASDIDTPRALAVYLLVKHGEWHQLQQLRVSPAIFDDPEEYWKDCLITDLLRKCKLPTGIDTAEVAASTFWACEAQNKKTNDRLARFVHNGPYEAQDMPVALFIERWRKNVRKVLGRLPERLSFRFSDGATYVDPGTKSTIPDKMSSLPVSYPHSRDVILPFWHETSWASARSEDRRPLPEVVRGNIFFTVPKDGEKDRGCCKEASLNMGAQLDIAQFIRERLKSHLGIDLKTGQQWHKTLARLSSLNGRQATLDQSNASDTLARSLVKLGLDEDWYDLLSSLRATHTRIKGKWVRLEKFSSMGNGFTFELETLIFATLARTVCECVGSDPNDVSCYGDDLIVPSEAAIDTLAILKFMGFTPNERKSFTCGPFRESCGGDFFSGVAVRGTNLEELPDEPQKWISLANNLRRVAHAGPRDLHNEPLRWGIVRRAWADCLAPIPSVIRRCRGPEWLGDIVIHDIKSSWSHVSEASDDPTWDQRYVKAYVPVPQVLPWHHWTASVQLASCTLGLPSLGITPRGGVSGYRIKPVPILGVTWTPS